MEWGKIKTILIFIFVIVNLFLFIMFFKSEYVDNVIGDELVENTVKILEDNNVLIDKSVIPKTHDSVRICIVENKYSSISDMLKNIWTICAENDVTYFNEKNTDIHENYFVCTVDKVEEVSNITKYAKREIEKTGLLENAEYVIEEDDEYVYFYLKFGNKIFYDSYIKVRATKTGIKEIYGYNWLGDIAFEGGISQTVSPVEIIIDFTLANNFQNTVEIESVKSGYYIGERGDTVRVTASPVWEISLNDGQVFYYDMRNGDLLKHIK
ncbi:MAG: hypothetical protein UH854_01635 [Clostridia bacterium]|nr:hypothetical protein [Clostridia bacterium]